MTANFKDHFSTQSSQYQRYRPRYPQALFQWLATQTPQHELAWDCATGNGQAALALTNYFEKVIASDASDNQIAQCLPQPRVEYRVAKAEQAPYADASVDLITVAQALHWFDQAAFYQEAWRVLKAHAVLAVWSYKMLSISPKIDAVVHYYYRDIVGPYWPPERKLVEQGYAPLPAPFHEIDPPDFSMTSQWDLNDLLGYLGTWSASVYYSKTHQQDPVSHIRADLSQAWDQAERQRTVHWPLELRVGVKHI
jgi:SAM-dependent methyltransferase